MSTVQVSKQNVVTVTKSTRSTGGMSRPRVEIGPSVVWPTDLKFLFPLSQRKTKLKIPSIYALSTGWSPPGHTGTCNNT